MFLLLSLFSCLRSNTISRDQLRSKLLAGISLASETELFIDQLQKGRATSAFAKSHLAYVYQEASRSADELRQTHVNERMADTLENGRAQLDSLATMLAGLKEKPGDQESLSAGRQQAARIRMALTQAKDEL
jgi:hypothetical protein